MITADTQKFTLQIGRWVQKVKGKTKRFATEFIQDLNEAVVEATPVYTGFLRGSWHASLNGPPSGEGAPDKGGSFTVSQVNLVAASLQLGDIFYMLNGAKYAARVEYGFVGQDSLGRNYNQPPHSFVRATIDRAQSIGDAAATRVAAQ